jgi:hypothetical protein
MVVIRTLLPRSDRHQFKFIQKAITLVNVDLGRMVQVENTLTLTNHGMDKIFNKTWRDKLVAAQTTASLFPTKFLDSPMGYISSNGPFRVVFLEGAYSRNLPLGRVN